MKKVKSKFCLDVDDFGSIYPLLLKVKETYPSRSLKYEYIQAATDATLDQAVTNLEKVVKKWYCKGYRYINLPNQTLLSQNWALGTAGGLGGVTAAVRFPEATFLIENAGFPLLGTPGTDNIYRFTDINTSEDQSLLVGDLKTLTTAGGIVFYIYQIGDPLYLCIYIFKWSIRVKFL